MGPILTWLVTYIEGRWPGAAAIIDAALASGITSAQLEAAIMKAVVDVQTGQSFLTVLQDVVSTLLPQTPPAV